MFKIMTGVLDKKKKSSLEDIEKIPPFLFCKWLSGNPYTIQAGNMFNLYHKIPIENQYFTIRSAFAGKIKYIPYPKTEKEDTSEILSCISEYFKISDEKAKEYIELISDEELNKIKSMFNKGK